MHITTKSRVLSKAWLFIVIRLSAEKGATLEISTAELIGKSAAEASIKVFLKGTVEETDQRFAIQDVVEFKKPGLNLTVKWVVLLCKYPSAVQI